ncbi:SGNH/GDSL hydrolase family protein [Serratia sp. KG1D]|uniref:SGNH/GDSL hydrolase family protein n=1 Tax=Serratia sp. KG1D TaxID=3120277 RepID=UPI003017D6A4
MATTPTNNPIPSEAVQDLKFNTGKIDQIVNSEEKTYTDRFGVVRYTWSGALANIAPLGHPWTLEEASAAISSGEIKNDAYFFVWSDDEKNIADVYQNISGVAVKTDKSYPSSEFVNQTSKVANTADIRTKGIRTLNYSTAPEFRLEHFSSNGVRYMFQDQFGKSYFPLGVDIKDAAARSISLENGTLIRSGVGAKYDFAEAGSDGNTIFATDDKGYKIYRNRRLFNNPGQIFGDAAICGDSITARGEFNGSWKPLSWHMWASLNLNGKFKVSGMYATSGFTITQIEQTHIPNVINSGSTICVLMAGRNDIQQGIDLKTVTIPTFKRVIAKLLRAGIIPVICTMAAQNNNDANRAREHELNAVLRGISQSERLPFVDLHAATVDPATGNWLPGYNAVDENGDPDPSHPSETGCKAMGLALSDALSSWLANVYPTMAEEQITAGLTNNILSNPLFLTLNGAGDTPDGWTTVTAGSSAITTDPSVKGNVWKLRNAKFSKPISLTPGKKMGFGFYIKASQQDAQQVEFYIANGDASSTNYLTGMRTWNRSVDGFSYFYHEFIVPIGVTTATLVASAGDVDLFVAQNGLFELSGE